MKIGKGLLYLPVEVKVRELDAKLLLAYYAAKEGYRIVIGEHKMVELAATKLSQGIFFSKGYPQGFRKRIVTNAKNNGHHVVELDEEGLIIDDAATYLHDRMKQEIVELISQEYCWGNSHKEVIAEAYPKEAHKCHVTGNPRFDLLKPKYRTLYEEEAKQIRSKYGKFILINTRFSIYNGISGKKSDHALYMYFKNLYDSFLKLIMSISNIFPDITIVLRPHPGENFASYRKAFSSKPNVHVVHEGNIIKWLMAAEAVIHNGCTSSVEAFLLERPVITYNPISSNVKEVNFPNTIGIAAANIGAVSKIIEDIVVRNNYSDSREYTQRLNRSNKVLTSYYNLNSKHYSYESILQKLGSIQLTPSIKTSSKQKILSMKENNKVKHFFPSLTIEEINNFFKKLDKIEGNDTSIVINRLGRNLYEVHLRKTIS